MNFLKVTVFFALSIINCSLATEIERSPFFHRSQANLYVARNIKTTKDYTYAICSQKESTKIHCHVRVTGADEKYCGVSLSAKESKISSKRLKLVSILHFTDRKAILKWLEMESENVVQNAKYTIVDMENCTNHMELSYPMDLPEDDPSFLNEIVFHRTMAIDVFISSQSACDGMLRCMLTLNSDFEEYGRPKDFKLNLVNPMLRSEFGDNFYAMGYDLAAENFRLFHLSRGGLRNELLKLNEDAQLVSSNSDRFFTVCMTTTKYGKKVHCHNYPEDAHRRIEGAVEFSEPVEIIAVTKFRKNEIILVTRQADCTNAKCSELTVTVLKHGYFGAKHEVRVDCYGRNDKIVVNFQSSDYGFDIFYGCEAEDKNDDDMHYFIVKKLLSL